MKRNVEIKKKIEFSSMIGEITAISLENNLEFTSNESIEGDLIVVGKYKKTKATQLEEEFKYRIPVEISLTEKLDRESGKVDIEDFYYDIVEENTLLCNITLIISGVEVLEERECDGDPVDTKEKEIPHIENNTCEEASEREEVKEVEDVDNKSIFNINDSEETYGTFVVYMVRENETINTIIEKYKTNLEEIEKYNDVKNIEIGSKIIIPIINE